MNEVQRGSEKLNFNQPRSQLGKFSPAWASCTSSRGAGTWNRRKIVISNNTLHSAFSKNLFPLKLALIRKVLLSSGAKRSPRNFMSTKVCVNVCGTNHVMVHRPTYNRLPCTWLQRTGWEKRGGGRCLSGSESELNTGTWLTESHCQKSNIDYVRSILTQQIYRKMSLFNFRRSCSNANLTHRYKHQRWHTTPKNSVSNVETGWTLMQHTIPIPDDRLKVGWVDEDWPTVSWNDMRKIMTKIKSESH